MGQRSAGDNGIFYGIWVAAGGFVMLFLYAGAGFYSFSIFISPLEEAFGWSRAEISLTMSIYLMVHGICAPLIGWLLQTYGPRKLLTAAAFFTGVFFFMVSFTPALWYFYLAYALLSVATTGIGYIPVSDVLSKWFIRRRGTAIGFAMVGISAGGLVMSPVVGYINTHFGWRFSFIMLGLMVWVLALPVTWFVMKADPAEMGLLPDGDLHPVPEIEGAPPAPSAADSSVGPIGWPLRAALRTRAFFFISLAWFLAPLGQMGVLQHQVPLIVGAGFTPATAATALGLTAGLGGLGKLSFGRLSEVLPFHYSAMLCFGMQALSLLVLLTANGPFMVWIFVSMFGFAMGGVVVLLPLVVGHFFGLTAFGVIVGVVALIQAVGSSSGALISGLIFDWRGDYEYALTAYIGIYLAGALSIFLAGKPRPYPGARSA
ncbi:MAG: MFS transporter [Proteobacteria bacterium]|nr:MFS transporter [Pseudomonadota bacterium]